MLCLFAVLSFGVWFHSSHCDMSLNLKHSTEANLLLLITPTHPLPLFLLPSKSRFCVGLAGTWPTSVAQYAVYIKSRVLVDIYEKKHSFGNILVRSNKLLKSSPPPALWVFYGSCIIHRLQQLFSRCPRYLFQPENNQRRKCVQNKVMWLQWFSISGLWVHGNSISDSCLSSYDCFFFPALYFHYNHKLSVSKRSVKSASVCW